VTSPGRPTCTTLSDVGATQTNALSSSSYLSARATGGRAGAITWAGITLSSHSLDHAELEQISYWRPSTVGELIFNYWD
jgi:hypothetical protein